jgi:alpha-L-fucosidase 2
MKLFTWRNAVHRNFFAVIFVLAPAVILRAADPALEPEHLVRFDAPATHFTEAAPLGNGRLGAMVFGGVDDERIVLNESGMWSGSPQDADRPDAAAALPEIRRLLLAGKNGEAEKLVEANFTCAGAGSGFGGGANVPYGCYQVLGDLNLKFSSAGAGEVSRYERELDLAEAVTRTQFERGGVRFEREAFVSAPDEVIVLHVTADKPGALSFEMRLTRPERSKTTSRGANRVLMSGRLSDGKGGDNVGFATVVEVLNRGGKIENADGIIRVTNADEVELRISAATDIKSFAGRRIVDAVATALSDLDALKKKSFGDLKAAHVARFQSYFNRVKLHLGGTPGAARAAVTQARLQAQAAGDNDPALAQLYFDFGRYLLISSSRPGGFPPNLQGIWADGVQTPWNGDWHLNVNAQMNYWPAEVANLSELHQPLFAFIASLQEPGARTAKKYYGARGWVAHVLGNPWGFTSPGEGASWGATTTGSAWLCQHLWEHYLFTGDRKFLEGAYPLMKNSALFYFDMLVEEPTHHWLVTAPANSPENAFLMPDGSKAHLCIGPTFDNQVLRYLFNATREAAAVLGIDAALQIELKEKAGRLPPTRIAKDGRVMEWLQEYPEEDPHHRHISHLWGLFPGDEIDAVTTPKLLAAARKTLEARGDQGTGWGLAHKLALWARVGDGDRAADLLRSLLKPAGGSDHIATIGGGTYPNLFDGHPPFQIDGNFGGCAAIAEMLVQSRATFSTADARSSGSEIRLLPALPAEWASGEVEGLRTRGGFEVSIRWSDHVLAGATVLSLRGGPVIVSQGDRTIAITDLPAGKTVRLNDKLERL